MKPKHHPDTSTLLSYAAGSLPEPLAMVTACHLSHRTQCRNLLHDADQIGSMLLDDITPTSVSVSVKQSLLARLDSVETIKVPLPKATRFPQQSLRDIPYPLNTILGSSLETLEWKTLVPGIKQHLISTSSDGHLRLLNISPGTSIPEHSHTGSELTLIIKGSITDETGQYCVGDMADLGPDIQHQPVVDTSEACICLVATDAPLRFKHWVPRMLQPLLKI